MAMNHTHFDFYQCSFKEANMYRKDRGGASREGCGRVALFKSSKIPHCYTLECNYNDGKLINNIYPEKLPNCDFLADEDEEN